MDAAESITESGAGAAPNGQPGSTRQVPSNHAPSARSTAGEAPRRTVDPHAGLSEREQAILAFERQWWKYAGSKEQAIRELFAMSSTRYYQLLNQLMDKAEAMSADPMLVKRLRRMRASRQRNRNARRLGIELHDR